MISTTSSKNVTALIKTQDIPSNHSVNTDKSAAELTKQLKNQKLEAALGHYLAGHPATKATINSLVNAMATTFIKAHGELKGWAEIIQAAARPNDSNRGGNGVLSPRFDVIGSVGWNGPAIKSTMKSGTVREQGTLFLNLLLSQNFKQMLTQLPENKTLVSKLSDSFDTTRAISDKDSLFQMTGWAAQTKDTRKQVAKAGYEQADQLIAKNQISVRELNYHRHNAVNLPINQHRVGRNIPRPSDEELKVLRGYGKDIWSVQEDSQFALQAKQHDKPVCAGPSGSTARIMMAAQLLAPYCQDQLGVKDNESYMELVRLASYAYFLQDDHHSMLEVNLGAASYGFEEQWSDELYTDMFKQQINGNGFSICNEDIREFVSKERERNAE